MVRSAPPTSKRLDGSDLVASEHEPVVDALVRGPFSETSYRTRDAFGGTDHHVVRLSATQDFWDDRSEEIVGPALNAIERERDLLADILSERWGPAETVDFWGDDFSWERYQAGDRDGGIVDFFRGGAGEMLAWRCPEHGRWVVLAVYQADREFPFELYVGVEAGLAWRTDNPK